MIKIGSECLTAGCSRLPKFYCCNPALPACSSCSHLACKTCHNKRNKPLKALSKQMNQASPTKICFKCHKNISDESVTFPCQHLFCSICICETVCKLIKSHKWVDMLKKQEKTIACICESHQMVNICNFLDKNCFCCGKAIENNEYIVVKNGLKLRIDCKNRYKYQQDLLEQNKSQFLTKKQIQYLLKREELHKYAKQTSQEDTLQVQLPKQIVINNNKVKEEPEKTKLIECIQCSNLFNVKQKSQHLTFLCQKCFSRHQTQQQKLQKKKQKMNKPINLDQMNFQKKKINLNELIQAQPKQISKLSHLKQYEICVSCEKKQYLSVTNTVSRQLGSFLCSQCYKNQNQILQRSVRSHIKSKIKIEKPVSLYEQYLQSLPNFVQFGKNITLSQSFSKLIFRRKERYVPPSIIQEHPDPVEMYIQNNEVISCFNCGLFLSQNNLIMRHRDYFCLTCYMPLRHRKN